MEIGWNRSLEKRQFRISGNTSTKIPQTPNLNVSGFKQNLQKLITLDKYFSWNKSLTNKQCSAGPQLLKATKDAWRRN